MTSISPSQFGLRGRNLALLTLAAGATVVGMMAAPAPAHAADSYFAVALGYVNENPPVTMAGGSATGASQEQAAQNALTNCANNGGSHCVVEAIATNECA